MAEDAAARCVPCALFLTAGLPTGNADTEGVTVRAPWRQLFSVLTTYQISF